MVISKTKGYLIGNDFERASLRINTELRKGRLTVGENILMSNTHGNNPGGGINAFYEAATSSPIIAVKSDAYINPVSNLQGWGFGSNDIPQYSVNYAAVGALNPVTYNYSKIVGNGYADFKLQDSKLQQQHSSQDTAECRCYQNPSLAGCLRD